MDGNEIRLFRHGMIALLMVGFILLAPSAAVHAICQANGRPCGNQGLSSNDRNCCPGSVCGWGNVCNPGCRINGVLYRAGDINPSNRCQQCTPLSSTTNWSSRVNGTACNDNNLCTQTDRCQAGVCVGTVPVVCPVPDQCHNPGTCAPATGVCSNPPKTDGCACSDGNACTSPDTCQSGACVSGPGKVCSPSDDCHVAGVCSPATGECSNPDAPDGTPCNEDGLVCTRYGCEAGHCFAHLLVCGSSGAQCVEPDGICVEPAGCTDVPAPDGSLCNDGDSATTNDRCHEGTCIGDPT